MRTRIARIPTIVWPDAHCARRALGFCELEGRGSAFAARHSERRRRTTRVPLLQNEQSAVDVAHDDRAAREERVHAPRSVEERRVASRIAVEESDFLRIVRVRDVEDRDATTVVREVEA